MARTRSIKVLDFAMSSDGEGAKTCLQFVECLGLKTLFPALMGKASPVAASYNKQCTFRLNK